MNIFFSLTSFIFGSLIGSFLNVVILRLPDGQSLGGRSHCPNCHRILGILDLFPIFSYLLLRARCRSCKLKISPRYLIIELLTGILFCLAYFYLTPQNPAEILLLVKFWIAIATLICVFVIDFEHFIILDNIIFPAGIVVLILNLVMDLFLGNQIFNLYSMFLSGIVAAFFAALPFFGIWYFSKGQWMGFGDVKLALFLGVALGMPGVFVGLMLAVLLGGVFSTALLLFTKSNLKTKLPFGTFLSIGAVIALFYGQNLYVWYLSILGF
jgi:leader peptidase (prepilin peptidase)/N-methyltransferase